MAEKDLTGAIERVKKTAEELAVFSALFDRAGSLEVCVLLREGKSVEEFLELLRGQPWCASKVVKTQ